MQAFKLVPFGGIQSSKIGITGGIDRTENQLFIQYKLSGRIDQIKLPAFSALPTRKNELWKSTCFEFFIAMKNKPQYWEFNMSPSGDWNIYVMDAYRRIGFREETRIAKLSLGFKKQRQSYSIETSMDLSPMFPSNQILQLGITAVIQTLDGLESYWALAHPGQRADFHLRESFILNF